MIFVHHFLSNKFIFCPVITNIKAVELNSETNINLRGQRHSKNNHGLKGEKW